jgi:hypothetical protein
MYANTSAARSVREAVDQVEPPITEKQHPIAFHDDFAARDAEIATLVAALP